MGTLVIWSGCKLMSFFALGYGREPQWWVSSFES